jgi:hypothetical protein
MSFKGQIASDVASVLLNLDEFAEVVEYHRVVGGAEAEGFPVDLNIVPEDEQTARAEYPDQMVSDKRELIVHLSLADVVPQVDTDYLVRDGEDWTVMEILGQGHGMARVRTEALGLVRRGGREVQR